MLLEIKDVSRSFGGIRALNEVNFKVAEGTIHGLIGPNGAGKTTLVNIVSGTFPPTSGEVIFRGNPIHERAAHQIAGLGIGRTFQNIRLFSGMTCLENILSGQHLVCRRGFVSALFNLPSFRNEDRKLKEQAMILLKRAGLKGRENHPAGALSYGERRRLEIARALAAAPRLLMLDEPVAGMRENETEQVAQLLKSLVAEDKITILLIEHNMNFVMGLCDFITVINFGCTVTTGTAQEVAVHPEVIEAYLGSGD